MPVEHTGLAGKISDTLNEIIERNQLVTSEIERVAVAVGKEGQTSQRLSLGVVSGTWNNAVDSLNGLITDLVQPTQETARVIGAVARGDLSQTMATELEGRPLKGEFLRTARVVNGMVDQLASFAPEVTRVAREVGTEGRLGGQAAVEGVAGTWKDLTDSVNRMAANLTDQVRNIAYVTVAVANGDLSKKITVDVRGEFLQLKDTINTMVDQLRTFSLEVSRVAREVGTEGRLGGQAVVLGVAGTWKDLTDSVNSMASNLTSQVRNIAEVSIAVARGDLTRKITVDVKGELLELKETINTMVDQLRAFSSEVTRVAREVGTEGRLAGQADVPGVGGTWKDLTDSVNLMASNLTAQVRNIAEVTTAVANGDLSRKMTVDVKGELLELKNTMNTMVDQLNGFAGEVTRVAREVGTEGKLGGQAQVKGIGGVWKNLTDSVNSMAWNLTAQVRNIAEVTTAVANGDLTKKMTVDVEGEILALKKTINTMVDQLSSFASEVTRVAREVGTEGQLGGQAVVKGVGGVWKDLTDSVNGMAGNLTGQVRNIADVTTAIAGGDLSKKITAEAKGELLQLKDTINTMVDQLSSFASEVTRVAREVGTEGKLAGQAVVKGVGGVWSDLTDSVNLMASNLTNQVRNIAEVTTAVANGDLGRKITVDAQGEILELKKTINTMVDQLSSFAAEVTRVAREVGTEGQLGGQADVKGVGGVWKDLTDSVNGMASNLTGQVRNIAEVTTAVANGDLSRKITVDAQGEIMELKDTINTMVEQLRGFAAEVTRMAREVGTEGKLGGQAVVRGIAGTWKDLTDSVNSMASNLTGQVRNIAEVTTAVANGDLSKKIAVDVRGEMLELKNTINTMVDQLSSFAAEVTRVAREVGTEGKLGGQAVVRGAAGTWKDLTDSVNSMASNLTGQVRNIAEVTTAVAKGDLNRKITVDVRGEMLELKNTVNTMVDQLSSFAAEVTRVAREVGTEGKLGGQGVVRGVAGTWKDLTDSVNGMASNLTSQVRNIAEVTTAVANGDLGKKITVDAKGEILELKNTINTMVDQLSSFASEVTRVAREVGTEGKLGGQASVRDVAGTWRDLTDSVNGMASNLTGQVRNIADVTTAVANGDLSKKITVAVKGELLQLKNTINTMVDQLSSFASEVTRVSREVGTEGKLGGQALVRGVAGTWKDLTDSVNGMASNLTGQVRNIAEVTTAVATGDLGKKITVDAKGEILELKNTINTMVDQLNGFASEVTRVAREVGTEGKLGGQAFVKGVGGTWKDLTDNVNGMAANLTEQVRNIAEVTTAIAGGDLSKKITAEAKGELLQLKNTVNTMVDQLNGFASEVTRVAREVGTEGKLGGQASVRGVGGTWKDLTDNVNFMASNLTTQVRGIAKVVTAVANGDLKRKLVLEAKGEIAELADTINAMIDTLALFADQVTGVAREVGIEGKLGAQAHVPGAAGIWRDLTDNVNQLAGNLTTQVRAIAEVSTAVTQGDLTRSIMVHASGEVAALKDNINQMIRNLQVTTHRNTEQDWLKTNLARLTRMMQGQRDMLTVAKSLLSEVATLVTAQQGAFYLQETDTATAPHMGDGVTYRLLAGYAYRDRKGLSNRFKLGEGLVGQCALEKERILVSDVPSDYVQVSSGLGEATPRSVVVLPVVFEGQVKAVVELGSFNRFSDAHLTFLEQLAESVGIVLNTIEATMRTEELLKSSQALTEELQSGQEELTETNKRLEAQAHTLQQSEELLRKQQAELQAANEELEERAVLLGEQKSEVEKKNQEVERARTLLEEKAEQLALTSKYKSEFLANMSHELRTPLNSLLILSKLLGENVEGTLTPKQVEYAKTVHGAGTDLLELINDILDLSKIESGTMEVDLGDVRFKDVAEFVERTFRQTAVSKGLDYAIEVDPLLPESMRTDGRRVQQVLKNLLSNAFKFTERGGVTLKMARAAGGWSEDHAILSRADGVVAFSVTDTGIGIPKEKHRIIFEAFQQADGSTSRKYGGTGLGLSISREIAGLLGGQIRLESAPGEGSTFTLYLPLSYVAPPRPRRQGRSEGEGRTPPSRGESPRMQPEARPSAPVLAPVTVNGEVGLVPAAALAEADEERVPDDRAEVKPEDRVLLIVEDDASFARILLDMARDRGFKGLVAGRVEHALTLLAQYKVDAVTLDLKLPDRDGWIVLDRLKHDARTRHVPVHIISVSDEVQRGLAFGAMAYLQKPASREALEAALEKIARFVDRPVRRLLVAEDDERQRAAILELIGNHDVRATAVGTGEEALAALASEPFDCMVLDLGLPDIKGIDLLHRIKDELKLTELPIIIYTARDLSKGEETEIRRMAEAIVVKDVRSPERLLDETSLFLHRVQANLPEPKRKVLEKLQQTDTALAGRSVMVVDDDVRNIFALTTVLERHGMKVSYAETGKDAIAQLKKGPGVEAVLMDIMMPELDGYETTRQIRKMAKYKKLPIIALTAKAMKGDREKCIEAGASDYVAKPVDADQLISLLRVWLYR
ncbi:MAG: HAMP domain-containing protein [Deltaproteobacteria bacterium]|nr:HAMP domain-containing protein [Deltaproteobacteria bacterium]